MLVFGPVPSRRLGRSVGINNIPPKLCDYSCIYCQLGRSTEMIAERKEFYPLSQIIDDVDKKVKDTHATDEVIDYLTFVPDGEPTLDVHLGKEIEAVKKHDIPVAVICNSSLIWRDDVQKDLLCADLVSLKVDAVEEQIWKRIDRPHKSLSLDTILDGIQVFSEMYEGRLITETMLVKGVNDSPSHLEKLASFLGTVSPETSYISVPIRPPAETYAMPPGEDTITMAYQIFSTYLEDVEYLIGYEGNKFSSTGDLKEDILDITSVHPMKEEAIRLLIDSSESEWDVIEEMVSSGVLVKVEYRGDVFYVRKLRQ